MKIFTILFFILLVLKGPFAFSQNQIDLKIDINKVNASSLELNINLKNVTDGQLLLFKPEIDNICYGLVYIIFQNLKDSSKVYSLFPCKVRADLGEIILTDSNSVYLNGGGIYNTVFVIDKNKIPMKIKKSNYSVFVAFNYSYGSFISNYKNVYRSKTASNKLILNN